MTRDYALEADYSLMFIHEDHEYEIFAVNDENLGGGYVIEATKDGKPFVMGPEDQPPARVRYLLEPEDIQDFRTTYKSNLINVMMEDYATKIREFC